MKILFITSRITYPNTAGYNIAVNNMIYELQNQNINITLFSLNTSKHFININKISPDFIKQFNLQSEYIDTSISLFLFIKSLIKKESFNIIRFYNKNITRKLINIIKQTILILFNSKAYTQHHT
jgi:hypothetical protein